MPIDKSHAIIAAHDQAFGIGKHNELPWRIKGDLKFFRTITSEVPDNKKDVQNAVIMGRNTWESLPDSFKPLPERINVVLTKNPAYLLPKSVLQYPSLENATESMLAMSCARIFVIGGAVVYQKAIKMGLLTLCMSPKWTDTMIAMRFFLIIIGLFDLIDSSATITENNYNYRFKIYKRKS